MAERRAGIGTGMLNTLHESAGIDLNVFHDLLDISPPGLDE